MDQQPAADELPALRAQLLQLLGEDAAAYPARLEASFPRILKKIVELWGRAELDAYLDELMVSERPGRHGFPADVAMEIFRLSNAHARLHLSDGSSGTGWAGIQDPDLFRKALDKDND